MAAKITTQTISIDGYETGGTIDLPLSDMVGMYIITGTPILTDSLNLATTGTPLKSHSLKILLRPGVTLGESGVLSIEGVNIGVSDVPRLYELLYDGTAWGLYESYYVTPIA